MVKKIMIILALLMITACTNYEYTPTGEVVDSGYQVGDQLEVTVTDVNEQGYGVVRRDDLTILVREAEVNSTVTVELTQLTRNIAFADIVNENDIIPADLDANISDVEEEIEDVVEILEPENETAPAMNETALNDSMAVNETPTLDNETGAPTVLDGAVQYSNDEVDIVAYEGDLIDLEPMVMDPDEDPIDLGYTSPFNDEGQWQTEEGDAGYYSVIITATDNKDSFVTKQMTVRVLVLNKPPVIDIDDTLTFQEGDTVELDPQITDPDEDEVVVTYRGWMTSRTKETDYNDAGTYTVTIRADDGTVRVYENVTIIINDVNREPVLTIVNGPRITVTEGDTVTIEAEAEDPDGDDVVITFGEPVDESGVWETERGDQGDYAVEVSATDGENVVTQEVLVEVLKRNEPPVIQSMTVDPESVVLKKPGDTVTITLDVVATDPDGDELTITYSGFMTSSTKTVEYGERGGEKTVTVTVSDGTDSVSQDVSFLMNNWPCFDCAP